MPDLLATKPLAQLVKDGKVVREGSGSKGDPFKFKMLVSCSHIYTGTREQECENAAQPLENTGQMLVPNFSQKTILVPDEKSTENQPGAVVSDDDEARL